MLHKSGIKTSSQFQPSLSKATPSKRPNKSSHSLLDSSAAMQLKRMAPYQTSTSRNKIPSQEKETQKIIKSDHRLVSKKPFSQTSQNQVYGSKEKNSLFEYQSKSKYQKDLLSKVSRDPRASLERCQQRSIERKEAEKQQTLLSQRQNIQNGSKASLMSQEKQDKSKLKDKLNKIIDKSQDKLKKSSQKFFKDCSKNVIKTSATQQQEKLYQNWKVKNSYSQNSQSRLNLGDRDHYQQKKADSKDLDQLSKSYARDIQILQEELHSIEVDRKEFTDRMLSKDVMKYYTSKEQVQEAFKQNLDKRAQTEKLKKQIKHKIQEMEEILLKVAFQMDKNKKLLKKANQDTSNINQSIELKKSEIRVLEIDNQERLQRLNEIQRRLTNHCRNVTKIQKEKSIMNKQLDKLEQEILKIRSKPKVQENMQSQNSSKGQGSVIAVSSRKMDCETLPQMKTPSKAQEDDQEYEERVAKARLGSEMHAREFHDILNSLEKVYDNMTQRKLPLRSQNQSRVKDQRDLFNNQNKKDKDKENIFPF